MALVYKWPPVGVLSSMWTKRTPIARSQSLITGAPYGSAFQRPRYYARVRAGGNSFDYTGHGYMEVLKEFLQGGLHYVRLDEIVEPHALGMGDPFGGSPGGLTWRASGVDELTWTDNGTTLLWSSAAMLTATVSGGSPYWVQISGLPPNRVVARPGQRILLMEAGGVNPIESTLVRVVRSNAAGVAVARLMTPAVPATSLAILRYKQSKIFMVDGPLPEVEVPVNQEPIWDWKFREVFPDEMSTPITELNPW